MRKSAGNNNNIFACVVKGTLWGIACGAVSLLIFAAIGLSLPDPEKYSAPLALAALFISAFVGAFLSARKCGDGGLRAGLFSGVLFLLVLALAALGFGTSIRPRPAVSPRNSRSQSTARTRRSRETADSPSFPAVQSARDPDEHRKTAGTESERGCRKRKYAV